MTAGILNVRALTTDDAPALLTLRTAALTKQPLSFSSSVEQDLARSVEDARAALVANAESTIFGLFAEAGLLGMVGVGRARKPKRRHQASAWGIYTALADADFEAKRKLLEATIAWARNCQGVEQLHFSMAESATDLRDLCRSLGFQEWGLEPRALKWTGHSVNQVHVVLELENGSRA